MPNYTHSMEYAGLVNTRAVWRCVNPDCEISYSRQLRQEERAKIENKADVPEPHFPADWLVVSEKEGT